MYNVSFIDITYITIDMIEWLLFNDKWEIFQLYPYKLVFIVLAHCKAVCWYVHDALFEHIIYILFLLLNAKCLAERQKKKKISLSGLTLLGIEPMIYWDWGEHANHYITDAGLIWKFNKLLGTETCTVYMMLQFRSNLSSVIKLNPTKYPNIPKLLFYY